MIFVNDCPEEDVFIDGSYQTDEPEIRLVQHKCNMGIHASRVDGAREARGEWIVFLDQDDEIEPEYYIKQSPLQLSSAQA